MPQRRSGADVKSSPRAAPTYFYPGARQVRAFVSAAELSEVAEKLSARISLRSAAAVQLESSKLTPFAEESFGCNVLVLPEVLSSKRQET